MCFGTWSVKKFRSLCTHSPGIYAYLQVSTRFQTVKRYSWIHIPVGMASVDLERFIQNSRSGRKQTFSSTPQHGLELALHPATSQNAVVPSNFSQPQWGQINEDPAPPAVHTGGGVVNNYGCLILNLPACDGSAATQIVRSFIENMPQSAGRNPPTYACVGGGSIAGVSQESAAGQQTQVASNLGNTGHVPGIPAAPLAFITRATEASAPAAPVVPQRDEITQEAPVASQVGQNTQVAPVASQGNEITQAAQAPVEAPAANPAPQSEQATGSAGTGKTSFPWSKIFMGLFLFVVAVALGVCIWYHIQWVNGLVKTVQELSAEKNRNASPRGNDTAPTPSPQPAPSPAPSPMPPTPPPSPAPTSKQGAESPVSHMPHGNTTIQTNNSSCTFFYPCNISQVQSGNQSVSNNTTPLTEQPSLNSAPEPMPDWVPLGCNSDDWAKTPHNDTACEDLIPKNVTVDNCVVVCGFGHPAEGPKKCCPCARLQALC